MWQTLTFSPGPLQSIGTLDALSPMASAGFSVLSLRCSAQSFYVFKTTWVTLTVPCLAGSLRYNLGYLWIQIACTDVEKILPRSVYPLDVDLLHFAKFAAPATQHQLFQQSNAFTLVVLVSYWPYLIPQLQLTRHHRFFIQLSKVLLYSSPKHGEIYHHNISQSWY